MTNYQHSVPEQYLINTAVAQGEHRGNTGAARGQHTPARIIKGNRPQRKPMNTTAVTLSTGTLEDTDLDTALENILATDTPWKVIVWNDPVNLMTYVSYVFRSHFGYSRARAEELMLQVHNNGKAIVFTGSREDAEKHTQAMHAWGLLATFEKVEN